MRRVAIIVIIKPGWKEGIDSHYIMAIFPSFQIKLTSTNCPTSATTSRRSAKSATSESLALTLACFAIKINAKVNVTKYPTPTKLLCYMKAVSVGYCLLQSAVSPYRSPLALGHNICDDQRTLTVDKGHQSTRLSFLTSHSLTFARPN